ncbi:D-alanyl-D-alanine carboxypeptidase family protein [Desulfolucanica intricata]|uniref:D-alanyl-D-alanine carboxypeptidase family protein n=1 Tax=Desulfolucanica intricata TaxID=1285191 RepID=UPI00082C31BD|nr:D-alanyl-D-alanine carboxypeptidase family protein [Desulfolucanica intricata]
MHFKKAIIGFLCFVFLTVITATPVCAAEPPKIQGQAAVLIDTHNLQVLYGKNMHQRMYPASTTKILTGIIALEKGNLNDMVSVSWEAVNTEGTHIGLQEGEQLSLEDLLYALLLNSANDSAEAIAEHIGNSIKGFTDIMNDKAREIGAVNSHFNNPHGLPDDNHYTTAYDLALIAQYAMQNEKFREIIKVRNTTITRGDPDAQYHISNHNKLLDRYNEATGIKTGYTNAAGQCLVSSAKRGERELIAVVLKSEGTNIWTDSESLLRYGFDNFQRVHLIGQGQIMTWAKVENGEQAGVSLVTADNFSWNVPRGHHSAIRNEVVKNESIEAPVKKGQKLGELVFSDGQKELGRVDLVANKDVKRKVSGQWWFWPVIFISGLFLLRFWIRYRRRRKLYRRRKFSPWKSF